MFRSLAFTLGTLLLGASAMQAQILKSIDGTLHAIYPAGAKQGATVTVELIALQALDGAQGLVIDGPHGITVRDFKVVNTTQAQATLVIAPNAPPGRRLLRVRGGVNGLTSFRDFYVGTLNEVLEQEPNNALTNAQQVTIPAVINGRLSPELDVDCFAFQAKAGQHIVAAVLAHGMDSRMRNKLVAGYVDAALELLDAQGKVLASAEDTLGLDPLIEYVIPADGTYTVRVQALAFEGSPTAVYRLTLGDVPYPTAVFPAIGQRGQTLEVEFSGPNVPANSKQKITLPKDGVPWQTIRFDHALCDGRELPFVVDDLPVMNEVEPNDERNQAPLLTLQFPVQGMKNVEARGITVNGRFDKGGDVDCYRLHLKQSQSVRLEVRAQRHLRSPLDTWMEITDTTGKKLAENDEGAMFTGQCEHDFPCADSGLEFTAPADGDYFILLRDQNGTGGSRAVYGLTVQPIVPDFRLHQWPDAVPIWGPGTTAAFVVEVARMGGLTSPIRLRVEGLPEGWQGSTSVAGIEGYLPANNGTGQKVLLTITAPENARIGDVATFRVVGRAAQNERLIEHQAWPQTLLGSGPIKRMHLRYSPVARAGVAPMRDCRLETTAKELTVRLGQPILIPVKVQRAPGATQPLAISIDGETPAVGTAWRAPLTLKPDENELNLELVVGGKRKPGTYGIVIGRAWAADLRGGRPGPCTSIIILHVLPAETPQ